MYRPSPTLERHLIDVTAVLLGFEQAGFKLKASKCHFVCREVEYLGHLLTRDGIRANPKKIEIIKNWEVPATSSNLASFLGLAGYYRKLIPKFAQREASLEKDQQFTEISIPSNQIDRVWWLHRAPD
jgi:hypothetical protein